MMRLHQLEGERCERCGTPFETSRSNRRFCTLRCQQLACDERRKAATREANKGCTCPMCGAVFDAIGIRRKFCSGRCKNRAAGRRFAPKRRARRAPRPTRPCGICGQPFTPLNRQHLYCGPPCLDDARRRAQRMRRGQVRTTPACTICGTVFETWRSKVVCSPTCKREAGRRRSLAHYYARRREKAEAE